MYNLSGIHLYKSNCFVINFYVVGEGKLILGLEFSRKLGLISVYCGVEESTNFGKAQPANHAKAQTTHPLPSRSDSQTHQPDMTTVPPTNSEVDSKIGKSTDNFMGSPEQIQHDMQA